MAQDYALEFFSKMKNQVADNAKMYPGTTPPRAVSSQKLDTSQDMWLNVLPSCTFLVNGQAQKFYTIGALAQALCKKPVTIRSWEQKGWLPQASYRTPVPVGSQIPGKAVKGKRLYTKEQILFLVMAYTTHVENKRKPDWAAFRNAIKRQYPKQ